ncbi:MAG TPA: T9SS type A sorting domain-containing protein [Flavobacterium sp.]|nr:T9SS type A sorting domain-containing protein [Flavobacterium sp.]
MKKFYILFITALTTGALAQVPNSSFEETIGYGNELRYWGAFFTIPVTFDLNGTGQSDLIVYDGVSSFCHPVTDAFSGEKAMEIRNAYNETTDKVIPGFTTLFNESNSTSASGWNTGFPLPVGATVEFFGFHYKFFPLGNDVAKATLEVFGESGLIGTAEVVISGATTEYTYVASPIDFTSNETPVFMTISFSMAAEGSAPVFGSSLVIDDVDLNNSSLHAVEHDATPFALYPTLATDEIHLVANAASNELFAVAVIDVQGRTAKQQQLQLSDTPSTLNVGDLAQGVYILRAVSGKTSYTGRFIKK